MRPRRELEHTDIGGGSGGGEGGPPQYTDGSASTPNGPGVVPAMAVLVVLVVCVFVFL